MKRRDSKKILPRTSGRWSPMIRERGTPRQHVVGWLEVFQTRKGLWVSVPGSSRFVDTRGRIAL